jgi:RNA polymerase sigma factor (TIGR02999 family)
MAGTRPPVMSSQIAVLFQKLREGDQGALDALMTQVYGELRRIAQSFMRHQRPGHTLQPTALVNEAFIKLFEDAHPLLVDRAHFLALMARVMRQCWLTIRARRGEARWLRTPGSLGLEHRDHRRARRSAAERAGIAGCAGGSRA